MSFNPLLLASGATSLAYRPQEVLASFLGSERSVLRRANPRCAAATLPSTYSPQFFHTIAQLPIWIITQRYGAEAHLEEITMVSRVGLNGVGALAVMLTLDSVYADSLFRSVRVGSGQTVRVGVFGHVKSDCTAGRPLEVKVVAPPQHGVLAVRAGTMKLGASRQCANAEIPVNGVFYQARAGFAGDDEVTFEVTEPSNRVVRHVVKIVVGPQSTTPRADPRSL